MFPGLDQDIFLWTSCAARWMPVFRSPCRHDAASPPEKSHSPHPKPDSYPAGNLRSAKTTSSCQSPRTCAKTGLKMTLQHILPTTTIWNGRNRHSLALAVLEWRLGFMLLMFWAVWSYDSMEFQLISASQSPGKVLSLTLPHVIRLSPTSITEANRLCMTVYGCTRRWCPHSPVRAPSSTEVVKALG